MNPTCLKCGGELLLLHEGVTNYSWQCAKKCLQPIDTGVALDEDIRPFEQAGLKDGEIFTPLFTRPMRPDHVPGAKVYMPFILYHFIECTRGACYNSIYFNLLVPHFDCAVVLDYILRSPVIHGDSQTTNDILKPRIYSELHSRLMNVESSIIHQYLASLEIIPNRC
jgi:hypothetical protein